MVKKHNLVQNTEHKVTFIFYQEILDGFYSTSISNDMSIELESKDNDSSGS